MTNTYKWDDLRGTICGIWKFSSRITLDELKAVAEEWKRAEHNRYEDLYIRPHGKDGGLGIGFRWRSGCPADFSKAEHDRFVYKITDQLKRKFGNDLLGWDVTGQSDTTYILRVA